MCQSRPRHRCETDIGISRTCLAKFRPVSDLRLKRAPTLVKRLAGDMSNKPISGAGTFSRQLFGLQVPASRRRPGTWRSKAACTTVSRYLRCHKSPC